MNKKANWDSCSRDGQCQSGACGGCADLTGGCFTPRSKGYGQTCKADRECTTDRCSADCYVNPTGSMKKTCLPSLLILMLAVLAGCGDSSDTGSQLALEYSSNSGSGMLGVGWSLSGLSKISRCGKTIAADGATEGINYDGSDTFCLDGKKLVLSSTGSYGGANSEYRTERDLIRPCSTLGPRFVGRGMGTTRSSPAWGKPQRFRVLRLCLPVS